MKEAGYTPAEARDALNGAGAYDGNEDRVERDVKNIWTKESEREPAAAPAVDEDEYFRRGDGTKLTGIVDKKEFPIINLQTGVIRDHIANAIFLLNKLPVTLWFDTFKQRIELKAKILNHLDGQFSDSAILALRELCYKVTAFKRATTPIPVTRRARTSCSMRS
jgi:hypothetical protein